MHLIAAGWRISRPKALSYLESHHVSPHACLNFAFASCNGHCKMTVLFLDPQKLELHAGLRQNQHLAQIQQMQVCSPNFSHLHHPLRPAVGVIRYERL